MLQTMSDDGWIDMYGFVPEPVPLVDVETSNWFTSSHPHSPFVTGLIVARQRPDGTRVSLSDWEGLALTEQTPGGSEVTVVQRGQIPGLLADRFGLPGFAVDERGRVVRAEAG